MATSGFPEFKSTPLTMLAANDMKKIAEMIDPNAEGIEMGPVEEVDINHLDYRYVRECKDKTELKALLAYLRLPLTPLEQYQVKEQVALELEEWAKSVPNKTAPLPPVTNAREAVAAAAAPSTPYAAAKSQQSGESRIKSNDYRSWDRFDVEGELEKIEQSAAPSVPARINAAAEKHAAIPAGLTPQQMARYAENEKLKGNDCMRAQEYEDALYYYTTSIKLNPTLSCYNNRALTFLKLEKYSQCIDDCTTALAMEKNFKALLRRASAFYSVGRYQDATVDIDASLEMEPNSKEAKDLREKILQKWSDVDGTMEQPVRAKSSKMKIVEIDSDEASPPALPDALEKVSLQDMLKEEAGGSKITVVDVEDDSSDDEN
ncbi:hypothetical protein HDV03_005371 [Kappamyces sp. JEL0829]|nr:hypothetical protein HDV03_005371 [Kappamyces sp. JEL0829]